MRVVLKVTSILTAYLQLKMLRGGAKALTKDPRPLWKIVRTPTAKDGLGNYSSKTHGKYDVRNTLKLDRHLQSQSQPFMKTMRLSLG